MATKTFCDRCQGEDKVEQVSLEFGGKNADGTKYTTKTIARDLCGSCSVVVKDTLFEKLAVVVGR
jgi:hypothetical protein